jgi:hypothetical protein
MTEVIGYWEESDIKQSVMDRYDEYRSQYSSPRTEIEKWNMLEFILTPVLENLSSWETREKTAQAKLDSIQEIINEGI